MGRCICVIDQGTTSTRCMIFDEAARPIGSAQSEHDQIYPKPGWVEHDPAQILDRAEACAIGAMAGAGVTGAEIAGIGIANQRETVVLWDRSTGEPLTSAIVWQDTRTDPICRRLERDRGSDWFRVRTGLPISTYFAGPKIRWAIDNVPGVGEALRRSIDGRPALACGTIDAWLIWNLTGGIDGGRLVTDATNASRTMLMDLRSLAWGDDLLGAVGVPREILPEILPSVPGEAYGLTRAAGAFGAEVPVCGALGDQQAALLGQGCLEPGQTKSTYGTGSFMLQHTGAEPARSEHGLVSTVAAWISGGSGRGRGGGMTTYALEGSIAITGALVQWLRDNLGIIGHAPEIEPLAASVGDAGGVCIVPAFSGLLAPYWRADARGVITGITRSTTKAHIARAALEATCFQTREVLDAMLADSGTPIPEVKVDGGMVANDLLMQMQADLLGVPVVRPEVVETTSLGAAFAAGLSAGFFEDTHAIRSAWREQARFEPRIDEDERESRLERWRQAVQRSFDLAESPALG